MTIDFTHDPASRSWVPSANDPLTDFPLQNLPLGVIDSHIAIPIGDQWLDLPRAIDAGLFGALSQEVRVALCNPTLNNLLALGRHALRQVRHAAFEILREGSPHKAAASDCVRPIVHARPMLPCDIGDYTDFFASLNHAHNTFNLFRPGQEFLPNYKHVPIAYHGRSSSIFVAPKDFHRPKGQFRPDPKAPPVFDASRKLDMEVELGFYVGLGNAHGRPVSIDEAEQHLAGVCILNDWSARDVQAWESQPLGPFLSKNFVSAVSPWVVTLDALEPFRSPGAARKPEDPAPLSYLTSELDAAAGSFEIRIETSLQTAAMRAAGIEPAPISSAIFSRDTWWTPAQMVAHHTIGGCNLRSGDLIGSGTVSGPEAGSEGSLLELTWGGSRPIQLPGGESRSFLEDGDEILIRAWCERVGVRRIGLGECRGRVLPAREV